MHFSAYLDTWFPPPPPIGSMDSCSSFRPWAFPRSADGRFHHSSPRAPAFSKILELVWVELCWKLDLTPRLTWEHWIYGNYNGFPRPAEFLSNTRQRLHVNVIALSLFVLFVAGVHSTLSYIQNDYFLCKSMNEIRATGTYTCHVPLTPPRAAAAGGRMAEGAMLVATHMTVMDFFLLHSLWANWIFNYNEI